MNKNETTKSTVTKNMFWRFAERTGAQGVSFVVSIVLARMLAPEDYGLIALVTVFTNILQVFIDSGMGTALIQKKNADDLDFSSVFYFNVVFCVILYLLLFIAAPWISMFYGKPELTNVIRVLGLTLIISGIKNIQQAYVSKNLIFKRFFFATIIGTVISAFVGIGLAMIGFGVWALVAQGITNSVIDTLILWFTVKWRPKKVFSFARLKGLFSFGWKILCSRLLETVYQDIRQLIIGKMYSSSDLAFYNRGKQFPNLIITNINTAIDSVILPVMSNVQDKKAELKRMMRRAVMTSTYIIMPIMVGLAACSEDIVRVLLTDKWLETVPFIQVFAVQFAFLPIHTANLNAIKAMGRSDIFLKLEIIKKVMGIVLLFGTMWFGTLAMAYSLLANAVFSLFVNSGPNKKLLGYGYKEQFMDIVPSAGLAVAMGIIVFLVGQINIAPILVLLIQVLVGAVVYIAGSVLFKLEAFCYCKDVMMSMINKKK